jgi:GTP-binding protein
MLNFFDVEVNNKKPFYLVDIPGFGYSKAPKKQVDNWVRLIKDYLMGRPSLLRVFFLIDSRHGLKENDHEMMALLNKAAVSYQIILTKIDKISRSSCDETFEKVAKESKQYVACHPQILKTSSEKKIGILEIKKEIFELLLDKLA